MTPERILIVGYRGTGKTTVGRLLADQLGWAFADCDDFIEAAAGQSVTDIFAAEGEAGFRDREAAVLRELCARERHVVATGGGAVLRPANRELLRGAGFVAWLTASPETIWSRLQTDPTTAARRPNLTSAGGIDEVRTLIAAREPLYREVADFVADADTPSPDAIAATIFMAWRGGQTSRSSSGVRGSSSSA
jgi:shikimate kinase